MKLFHRYLKADELIHILSELKLVLVAGNNDYLVAQLCWFRTVLEHDLLMNLYRFFEGFQASVANQFGFARDTEIGINERFVLVEHHFRLKITTLKYFR